MRQAAVKVLRPELGAVLGVDRFLSEIRVTANLQHSNLLPLFDSGESDGLLYYVMPFVDGESLRQRLDRERQLPVDDAVRIVSTVGGALDYAHRHGVVHRDLTSVPVGTTPHASPDAAGRAMLGQEGLSPRYLDGATGCCSRAWTARRSWPRSIIDPAPNGRVLALQPAESVTELNVVVNRLAELDRRLPELSSVQGVRVVDPAPPQETDQRL